MLQTYKSYTRRTLAMLLAVLVAVGALFSGSFPVHAADGTISYKAGANIPYGSYFTSRMSFDGSNTAYCVEPLKKTPSSGSYSYDLLSQNSPLRKALYYLNGGYGYDKVVKDKYFSGWSDDNSYVIGHLVVAYIYAGNSADTGAFHGAPQSYIDKALEVASAIQGLPNPPEGFRAFIVPGQGSQTIAGSWYQVPNGWIELKKSSANGSVSDGNPNYSLKGAVYGIYQGEKLIQKLTTDENGYARSGELEEGDYTIKELSASKGYIVDTKAHKVTVKAEQTSAANVTDIPQNNPMNLVLEKLDAETKKASPQGAASLANAEFTVKFYTEQSDSDPAEAGKKPARTWVLKTDVSGKMHFTKDSFVSGDAFYYTSDGKTVCLPLGTITVQESKAPAGYQLNPTVFVQKITGDGKQEMVSVYQSSTIEESVIRGGVKIQKRDSETGEAKPQGSATLEGTVFAITTLNENPVLVDGTSYTKDQVVLTLTADKSGSAATAKDALPFGHYRVDETTAPSGYLNSGKISVEFDITEQGKIVELTAKDNSISNQVIRGDLEFVKIADGSQNRLANVPFKITSKTTGESHVIVTDANGYASTSSKWNKHTANTNRGESSEDGIWFGTSKPDDSKGALIYDTYTLAEQRCDSNKGMDLLTFEVKVYKDSVLIQVGTLTDDAIEIGTTALDAETGTHMRKTTVVFEELYQDEMQLAVHTDINDEDQTIYFPEIKTTAKDADTNSNISCAKEEITLVDTVSFKGLVPNQKYEVTGTLIDKETKKPVEADGKPVTAKASFKPKESAGTVDVTFTFDASSLKGKTVVVFESLAYKDKEVAVHTDIADEGQTIYFPEIKTTATDAASGTHYAKPEKELTLTDLVEYKNLIPGKEYKLTGTLMDAETEKPFDVDGKAVTAETSFTPEEANGSVELSFTFDASALSGKTLVAFETMTFEDHEVAVHADIKDANQTIYFPEIKTTAKDGSDGDQDVSASKEATIVDTVTYHGLMPGSEYKVIGTLMNKETGEALLKDGKPVTAQAEFKAEKAGGSVEVTFTFDASALAGQDVVVFEKLYYTDGKTEHEIASHEDLKDEGQTVHMTELPKEPETPPVAPPVKTGDETPLLLYAGIAIAALAGASVLGIVYFKRKKKHQ